jgi:PIN domain nuclease of toxin-antitoxin system
MKNVYVFDACSVIALLTNEDGADIVKDLLEKAINSEIKILMHRVNFLHPIFYSQIFYPFKFFYIVCYQY